MVTLNQIINVSWLEAVWNEESLDGQEKRRPVLTFQMISEEVDRQASMDQKVVDLLPRFLLNVQKLSFFIYFLDAGSSKLFIILVPCK